jgi:fructose-bisphosphate aldolase class I
MNTQLLVETASRLVDDDKGILAMNCRYKSRQPWQLSFSFGRALQQPVLEVWRGETPNVEAAQKVLMHRARCNRAARRGEYTAEMECQ